MAGETNSRGVRQEKAGVKDGVDWSWKGQATRLSLSVAHTAEEAGTLTAGSIIICIKARGQKSL